MPDSEKVIKAFEICYIVGPNCTECPLFYEDACNDRLLRDTFALLREHEPVKPEIHNSTSDVWYYICGECKTPIGPGYCYCSHCGKKVKWDA